jgi:stage II sporulation protein D
LKRFLYVLLFALGIYLGLPAPTSPALPTPQTGADPILKITVYHAAKGVVVGMDLEEYVKGVVASEMPASFDLEALKAQAILARTYASRKMRILGGTPSRQDADVTSDHAKDQAWAPQEEIKERWGPVSYWLNWPKIERAVDETRGLILTYDGAPAEVVFHSTCGGKTEAAGDVWTKHLPYLQSVACNFCQHSPYSKPETVTIPLSKVSSALGSLGVACPVSTLAGSGFPSVSEVSPTGRIKKVTVAGEEIRGLEFRMALGLRSTNLSWSIRGNNAVFQVRGYGHGVGMCQYGADGMAKQGRNCAEILSYYFPGTKAVPIFEE